MIKNILLVLGLISAFPVFAVSKGDIVLCYQQIESSLEECVAIVRNVDSQTQIDMTAFTSYGSYEINDSAKVDGSPEDGEWDDLAALSPMKKISFSEKGQYKIPKK